MLFNSTFENITCQAVVAHAFSPSPWEAEAEAGRSLVVFEASQLDLECETSQGDRARPCFKNKIDNINTEHLKRLTNQTGTMTGMRTG